MNIEELGLELYYEPITDARVVNQSGKWLVEYKRKPLYFFDRWWWFTDGVYHDYKEAYSRAALISSECGIKKVKPKRHIFKVKSEI